jgi:hypothetical protein
MAESSSLHFRGWEPLDDLTESSSRGPAGFQDASRFLDPHSRGSDDEAPSSVKVLTAVVVAS